MLAAPGRAEDEKIAASDLLTQNVSQRSQARDAPGAQADFTSRRPASSRWHTSEKIVPRPPRLAW
jgi:hypothetical protein